MRLSIIVPVLNEAEGITNTLELLQSHRDAGHEVIVVDGGSDDDTLQIVQPLSDQVLESPAGRARQMNAGATKATGDYLLFLHADTQLPADGVTQITRVGGEAAPLWGRFDVRLSGKAWPLRIVEYMMNRRSKLSGIATGDQAIFVRRDVFERVGGYADIPLMEDIDLSKRLKQQSRPLCIKDPVTTSSRRWEEQGIWSTILLMWKLRLLYFFGVSPDRLVRWYYPGARCESASGGNSSA